MKTKYFSWLITAIFSTLLLIGVHPARLPAEDGSETKVARDQATEKNGEDADGDSQKKDPLRETVIREGIAIDFTVSPLSGFDGTGKELYAGDLAEVTFRIADAETGEPLQGQFPGVWIDMPGGSPGSPTWEKICRERVGQFLQGYVGIRPMFDLNSYYILVLNRDPSIAVIDPFVGITGITKLYSQVILKRSGADWTKTKDEKRLFVSMPVADMVAVVNLDTFKLTHNVPAGNKPVRIRLQPDGKYLWVGNDSRKDEESGVTVIEVDPLGRKTFIPTGMGHHEIAFTDDSRYAFVGNREGGTVTVIDTAALEKVKDIEAGTTPISLAYSTLGRALYVADGQDGTITVIDGRKHDITARIEVKPGLGPLGFSQDGRWAVAVNSLTDEVYVIDPATNEIAHTITVEDEPYQVAFSRSFAYIRSLGSERVSMLNLSALGKEGTVPLTSFPAGQTPPVKIKDLTIADSIVEAPGEAAVLVVSPADATVYFYMEGMNAPMGNFRNYGHMPQAVQVADRSMQEREPGVYTSTIRIPDSGTYSVAFLMESPSIFNCFSMTAKENPLIKPTGPPITVEYLVKERKIPSGETYTLRFRLNDFQTKKPRTDLKGVSVLNVMAPGTMKAEVSARHVGEGIYEADLAIPRSGAYYIYVGCSSLGVNHKDLPYLSLVATSKEGAGGGK